jgi:serine/threonine protein kinase
LTLIRVLNFVIHIRFRIAEDQVRCCFTEPERVGRGSFGTVYHTELTQIPGQYCVKVLDFEKTGQSHIHKFHQRVYTEIDIMQLGSENPRVCDLVGAVFVSIQKVWIVMKRYHTTLQQHVRTNTNLLPTEREDLALQCVDLLQMVYKFLNVIHGDIKMDNIFVDLHNGKHTLVLGDFGNTTSTHHTTCVGFNPQRQHRGDAQGKTVVWDKKTYHCNSKSGTTERDVSVDLFAMMFVIMEVILGKKGIYSVARNTKVVPLESGVNMHGEHAREFIALCASVLQHDFTPTPHTYCDFLQHVREVIKRLFQNRPHRAPLLLINT